MILFAEQCLFKKYRIIQLYWPLDRFFRKKCIKWSWFDELRVVSLNKNDISVKFRQKINDYPQRKKNCNHLLKFLLA